MLQIVSLYFLCSWSSMDIDEFKFKKLVSQSSPLSKVVLVLSSCSTDYRKMWDLVVGLGRARVRGFFRRLHGIGNPECIYYTKPTTNNWINKSSSPSALMCQVEGVNLLQQNSQLQHNQPTIETSRQQPNSALPEPPCRRNKSFHFLGSKRRMDLIFWELMARAMFAKRTFRFEKRFADLIKRQMRRWRLSPKKLQIVLVCIEFYN